MKVPLHSLTTNVLSNPSFDCFGMEKKKGTIFCCKYQTTALVSLSYKELEIIFANIRV